MSEFVEKIARGESPTEEDWMAYLEEAHRQAPGMTPAAFAEHKTAGGENSYALLANSLESVFGQDATIVDLACGDGHLINYLLPKLGQNAQIIGVDMSEGELTVARRTHTDRRVSFYLARAQKLPLADRSVDHVLCHMAFMLMLPIEPVIQEIHRVLKPGGRFTAVTNGYAGHGVFTEIQKITNQHVTGEFAAARQTRTGDPRVRSLDGLRELFAHGFQKIEEYREFELKVDTDFEGLWDWMKNKYFVGWLTEESRQSLKSKMLTFAEKHKTAEGRVQFDFPMRIFSAVKRL